MKKFLLVLTALLLLPCFRPAAANPFTDQEYENFFRVKIKITHITGTCKNNKVHYIHRVNSQFRHRTVDYHCLENWFECTKENESRENREWNFDLVTPLHFSCTTYKAGIFQPRLRDYNLELEVKCETQTVPISDDPLQGIVSVTGPGDNITLCRIPVEEVFYKEYTLQFGCELLTVSVVPYCKNKITGMETSYKGYPYSYVFTASRLCENRSYVISDSMYFWQYKHDGMSQAVVSDNHSKNFSLSPSQFPNLPLGSKITVQLLNGDEPNNDNTRVVYFYPQIPQPVKTQMHIIHQDSVVRKLHLVFDRNFDRGYNERITKITVYKELAQSNVNGISESRILYQTPSGFSLSSLGAGNTYDLDIPASVNMKSGVYHITAEGTAKGINNNPAKSSVSYPDSIKNAMFKVVKITVKATGFVFNTPTYTPPSCNKGYGKFSVTFSASANGGTNLFYWEKDDGSKQRLFTTKTKGFQGSYIFSYDSVTADMRNILVENKITYGSNTSIIQGRFQLDVTQPEPITVPIEVHPVTGTYTENGVSNSTDDGYIIVRRSRVTGGTSPYTFSLTPAGKTAKSGSGLNSDIVNIGAGGEGVYNLKITDAAGCSCDSALRVTNLGFNLSVKIREEESIDCKGGYGRLGLNITTNIDGENLSYMWYKNGSFVSGARLNSFSLAGAGTYKVVVSDEISGLSACDEYTLTEPAALEVLHIFRQDIACYGKKTGILKVDAQGGTAPYSFIWSDGISGKQRSALAAGGYKLTVIDANGCTATANYNLTQPDSPLNIVIDTIIHSYYDADDQWQPGRVEARVQGGTPGYSEIWAEDADVNLLLPGTHTLRVQDANHCSASKQIEVEQMEPLEINIVHLKENLCYGNGEAAAKVEVEGGIAPYRIVWSNGTTQDSAGRLAAGIYSVRVTDRVGARREMQTEISQPDSIKVQNTRVKNPSYAGLLDGYGQTPEPDGVIETRISGGTAPMQLTWKLNGEILADKNGTGLYNLDGGNYRMEITDANGCTQNHRVVLKKSAPLNAEIEIMRPVFCYGQNEGILKAAVSGGEAPYAYRWYSLPDPERADLYDWDLNENLVADDSAAKELYSGFYGLKVSDRNGVVSMATVYLPERDPLRITVNSFRAPSYPVGNNGVYTEVAPDGEINASFVGGTLPYTYSWSDLPGNNFNGNTAYRNDFTHGSHRLYLTDSAGCTADTAIVFPYVAPLVCRVEIADSIRCYRSNDGVLGASVQGGIPPYSVSWKYGNETFENPDGLKVLNVKSGQYILQVTDSQDMKTVFEIFVSQPDSLIPVLDYANSPCHNDSAAWVKVSPQGGSAPYAYAWNINGTDIHTAENPNRLDGLENAEVKVTVSDRHNCRAFAQVILSAPQPLQTRTVQVNPSYTGTFWQQPAAEPLDGSIAVGAYGGTAPYFFTWNNGENDSIISGLDTGFYKVSVRDMHGCRTANEFNLTRIKSLETKISQTRFVKCYGLNEAALLLEVKGGVEPYSFQWFKDGEWIITDNNLQPGNLGAGTYTVTVWDANGTLSRDSIVIEQPTLLQWNEYVKDATAWHFLNGEIKTEVYGGTPPYSYRWQNGELASHDSAQFSTVGGLKRGGYIFEATDNMGCKIKTEIPVSAPDTLYVVSAVLENTRENTEKGAVHLNISGGIKPYAYRWSTPDGHILSEGETSHSLIELQGLAPGIYAFYLTDGGGAALNTVYEIKRIERLAISIHTLQQPLCPGSFSAALQGYVQGGVEPYRYEWQKWINGKEGFKTLPDTGQFLRNIERGQYRLFAYDADRDTVCAMAYVTDPAPMKVSSRFLYNDNLPEESDAEVMLWVENGAAPYEYIWNEQGLEGSRVLVNRNRSYSVLIRDANGCETGYTLDTLFSLHMEAALYTENKILCAGDSTASLRAEIKYGRSPLKIVWSRNGQPLETDAPLLENLTAGVYRLEVIDALGNTQTVQTEIEQPLAIETDVQVQNPSCHGFDNGRIRLEARGGTGALQMYWSTREEGNEINNLPEGVYSVRIQDRNFCTRRDTFRLVWPEKLRAEKSVSEIICPFESGRIRWSASGGTAPYTYGYNYSLQDIVGGAAAEPLAENKPNIDPAPGGLHHISITDSHQCIWDTVINLIEPEYPQYRLDSLRYLCRGQEITINVEPVSRLENPDYIWTYPDGTRSFESGITTRQTGLHRVLMIRNGECFFSDSVLVEGVDDSIHGEFWVSSHIYAGENCLLVNLSEHKPDSIVWDIPEDVDIVSREGNYIEVRFPGSGNYTLGMTAYKGLCSEQLLKNVNVSAPPKTPAGTPGNNTPDLQWKFYPNPSRGECTLNVTANAPVKVRYKLVAASNGICVESGEFTADGAAPASKTFFRNNTAPGLYLLIAEYRNQRRAFKLVRL